MYIFALYAIWCPNVQVYQQDWRCDHRKTGIQNQSPSALWFWFESHATLKFKWAQHVAMFSSRVGQYIHALPTFSVCVTSQDLANPTSGSNWKFINIHRLLSKHVKANFPNGGWEANQQPPRQAADPAAPKLLTGVLDLSSNPNLDWMDLNHYYQNCSNYSNYRL